MMMESNLTNAEIAELLGATLHGPLPTATMHRVFSSLGELSELRAKLAAAEEKLDRVRKLWLQYEGACLTDQLAIAITAEFEP